MRLRQRHQRIRSHECFAVRFAYWNFLLNSMFAVVFLGPIMVLTFTDRSLGKSVMWVAFLSVWALFATHAGGAIAAYAAIHAAEGNTRNGGVDGP